MPGDGPERVGWRVRDALGPGVGSVEVTAYPPSTSHAISAVAVTFDDGSHRKLLHKDLSPAALVPEAVGMRPAFAADPIREALVYRHVLQGRVRDLGPACVAAGDDWVLVDELPGVPLWQVGDPGVWAAAAAWCGALDALDLAVPPEVAGRLVGYDARLFRRFARRAARYAAGWDRDRRRRLTYVLDHYDTAIAATDALPRRFVHGELYPFNVVVDAATRQVWAVDWEMAGFGTSLLDLAALVAGWDGDGRAALVDAYASAAGTAAPDPLDLARCELHRCVQWLGWARDWRPPADHAHDWLARAVELTDLLHAPPPAVPQPSSPASQARSSSRPASPSDSMSGPAS
jgi:hypothetical protein